MPDRTSVVCMLYVLFMGLFLCGATLMPMLTLRVLCAGAVFVAALVPAALHVFSSCPECEKRGRS